MNLKLEASNNSGGSPKLCFHSLAIRTAALLLCYVISGCSTFHREWKQAGAPPNPAGDITGRWQGTWKSEVTGHHGTLRCVATRESPEQYRFLYRATWKKILHGTYPVNQTVRREGATFQMRGGADLGKLYGGHYEYEGQATPTNFVSTYRSKGDHGKFEMTRP